MTNEQQPQNSPAAIETGERDVLLETLRAFEESSTFGRIRERLVGANEERYKHHFGQDAPFRTNADITYSVDPDIGGLLPRIVGALTITTVDSSNPRIEDRVIRTRRNMEDLYLAAREEYVNERETQGQEARIRETTYLNSSVVDLESVARTARTVEEFTSEARGSADMWRLPAAQVTEDAVDNTTRRRILSDYVESRRLLSPGANYNTNSGRFYDEQDTVSRKVNRNKSKHTDKRRLRLKPRRNPDMD